MKHRKAGLNRDGVDRPLPVGKVAHGRALRLGPWRFPHERNWEGLPASTFRRDDFVDCFTKAAWLAGWFEHAGYPSGSRHNDRLLKRPLSTTRRPSRPSDLQHDARHDRQEGGVQGVVRRGECSRGDPPASGSPPVGRLPGVHEPVRTRRHRPSLARGTRRCRAAGEGGATGAVGAVKTRRELSTMSLMVHNMLMIGRSRDGRVDAGPAPADDPRKPTPTPHPAGVRQSDRLVSGASVGNVQSCQHAK